MSTKINKLKQVAEKAKADQAAAQKVFQGAAQGTPEKAKAQTALSASIQVTQKAEAELEAEVKADAEAKAQSNKKTPKKKSDGPAVEISCPQPRRRAGLKFGPQAIRFQKDDLDEKQWEAINNDKMLKVQAVD